MNRRIQTAVCTGLTALAVALLAVAFILAGSAQSPQASQYTAPTPENSTFPAPTSLNVLPKNLTGQQVHNIMEQWVASLGAQCNSCHTEDPNNIGPNGRPRLNFADDSKPMKAVARTMYSMTERINNDYLVKINSSGAPVTCGTCHRGRLSIKPFVTSSDVAPPVTRWLPGSGKQPLPQANASDAADYASPLEVLLSPAGARLYVLCQQSEEVRVLDATSFAVIRKIAVGQVPRGFSLSTSGERLFVTNSRNDTLSVIDTGTLAVVATWPVGAEPSSVVEDRAGKRLFVANRISGNVAVLDAQTGAEEKQLRAGRGSSYLTPSPDGSRLYATHIYPNPQPHRFGLQDRSAPESEITVID